PDGARRAGLRGIEGAQDAGVDDGRSQARPRRRRRRRWGGWKGRHQRRARKEEHERLTRLGNLLCCTAPSPGRRETVHPRLDTANGKPRAPRAAGGINKDGVDAASTRGQDQMRVCHVNGVIIAVVFVTSLRGEQGPIELIQNGPFQLRALDSSERPWLKQL